jgi:hypothetical protein
VKKAQPYSSIFSVEFEFECPFFTKTIQTKNFTKMLNLIKALKKLGNTTLKLI